MKPCMCGPDDVSVLQEQGEPWGAKFVPARRFCLCGTYLGLVEPTIEEAPSV